MRILSSPVDFVKISIRSKRSLLLAAAVVSVMAILLTIPTLIYPSLFSRSTAASRRAEARHPRSVQRSNEPHVLAAAYYSLNDNLNSALMLSNQGPLQMEVRPALFNLAGERFDVPAVVLDKTSTRSFDLQAWVSLAGERFREGSIQVFYQGHLLELAGVLMMTDVSRSLIFDQELTEPSREFRSSRLESVWWLPSNKSGLSFAMSNTTDQPLFVTLDIERRGSVTLALKPRETRAVRLQDSRPGKGPNLPAAGGISLEHSGAPGAIIAAGFVQEPETGYSSIVEFSDPQVAKSSRLDGAGLRIGKISDEELRQVIVMRNVGTGKSIVRSRIPYTLTDGGRGEVALPQVELDPGEAKEIDLSKFIKQNIRKQNVAAAGLELNYSGAPGSVIASARSFTPNDTHVFRVMLKDAAAQPSSTGRYSWRIDESGSTFVYVKNATDRPQQYVFDVQFPGGGYSLGIKTLEAGQTIMVDIRQLRDSQTPNELGRKIPLDAAQGQAHWYARGPELTPLIGRVEQVDLVKGTSMTAACGECCPPTVLNTWMEPAGGITGFIGDSTQCQAMQQDLNCFGDPGNQYIVSGQVGNVEWSSDNTAVATVNSAGMATAQGVGGTSIVATWLVDNWFPAPPSQGFCENIRQLVTHSTFCDVQADPELTITGVQFVPSPAGSTRNFDVKVTVSASTDIPQNTNVTIELIDHSNPDSVTYTISPTNRRNSGTISGGGLATIEFQLVSAVTAPSGKIQLRARIYDSNPRQATVGGSSRDIKFSPSGGVVSAPPQCIGTCP